jgi:hypothetical protein
MSFTLEVTFKCLCFFAPEERDGQKRMHVLMPSTAAHQHPHHHEGLIPRAGRADAGADGVSHASGHGMEAHAVRVVFPRAGGKLALGEPGKLVAVDPGGGGIADFEPMEGFRLELGDGSGANLALPPELVILGRTRSELLTELNHSDLASRVLLSSGSVTDRVAPGIWEYKGQQRPFAQEVIWTVPDVPGDRLEWFLTPMNGGEPRPMPPLDPVDGLVSIAVQHVTDSQFPTPSEDRSPDQNGPHFEAFNHLVDPPATGHPTFVRKREGRTVYCASGGGS